MRKCLICGTKIQESMGSVHSGDFIEATNSVIKPEEIREYCYQCVLETIRMNDPTYLNELRSTDDEI